MLNISETKTISVGLPVAVRRGVGPAGGRRRPTHDGRRLGDLFKPFSRNIILSVQGNKIWN